MKNKKDLNSIGLVLGSGAFKGFAHIGVIKALMAHKIPINAVSGSSIGALVAAYFALHQEVDSLQAKILSEKNRKFKLSDFSWKGGMVSSQKFQDFISYLLGDLKFSDTKIPLRITATDLPSGLPVVFEKGSLASAVSASASVPLVFQPSMNNKRQFVDGALSNPVPVSPLLDLGIKNIIAVNLYHRNEFKDKKFTFSNVALRSIKIALYHLARHDVKAANICICPDISGPVRAISNFKLRQYLSPQVALKIINIGKKETEKNLADIIKMLKS